MRSKLKTIFGILLTAAASMTSPAHAGFLDNYGDWSAFTSGKGKNLICYTATAPTKSVGKYKKRSTVALVVSHGPTKKDIGIVRIDAGYTYKKKSSVVIIIGKNTYKMFTDVDTAWAAKSKTDQALVTSMKAGSEIAVRGESSRGAKTTDLYSLKGFTAAYKAISKACKVQ
jgi:invasion protein IalB